MAFEDIHAFAIFAIIGGSFGLVDAILLRRTCCPVILTLLTSGVAATIGGIWTIAFLGAAHSVISQGYSPSQVLRAGLGYAFLISFAAPFAFGLPGILIGVGTQCLIQWPRKSRTSNHPSPE